MAKRDIVVVGASAGGMDALLKLVAALPRDFPAALFIVWHMAPGVPSVLPEVLGRAGPLRAANPADGDPIEPGRIYVAPNDHHLLLERDYVRVSRGPKENRFRPAIDPLFRSAAYVFNTRAIGVVLSGALDDGTSGLWTIKLRGGVAIAQDPADARHRSMPLSALQNVQVDHKLPAAAIGELLGSLVRQEAPADPSVPETERRKTEREIRIAEKSEALAERILDFGELSPYTCPECRGVLAQLTEGKIVRFRCHTGHAFSSGALLAGTTEQMEARLWDAVRALDEAIMLFNAMGEQLARNGDTQAAEKCFDKVREAHAHAAAVRESATRSEALSLEALQGDAETA
jgi:two-component system, chemotaxis family, protein-glutamate methylesterase/glutaminase